MEKSKSKNMPKTRIVLVSFIALFLIVLFSFIFNQKKNIPKEVVININDYNYYLETAFTKKEQSIGLSNRQNLCINCGMLFIFPKEDVHSFWMKDTLIPLDIIWLNKKNEIVKISTALDTNSEKTYTNTTKAKYVIELNANEVFKRDLKVGDIIQLPIL